MIFICQRIRFDMPYPHGFSELPCLGGWNRVSPLKDSSTVEHQTIRLGVAGSNPAISTKPLQLAPSFPLGF